jgi:hypothetical protein
MKALGLLLFTFSLSVYAQEPPQIAVPQPFTYNYQVTCGPVMPIIEFLSKTQKEELTWSGSDITDGSVYSLWQDKQGNWTLLKKNTQIACIIGSGTSGTKTI